MGVLQRFKDIMSSNLNAALDKMEDPSKMVDQILRDLNDDFGKVKAETAGIMAEEQRTKRALEDCNAEIEKLQDYAKRAVQQGNDEDAKQFLTKKAQLTQKQAGLVQAYELAKENSIKMKQMHDKLFSQINEMNAKKDEIKSKMAVAKTQEKINKMTGSSDKAAAGMNAFDRMEDKANKMLDTANAMSELNKTNSIDDIKSKYDTVSAHSVDDELEALKRQTLSIDDELANLKNNM